MGRFRFGFRSHQFKRLVGRLDVIGIDRTQPELIDRIIQVRKQHRLKLPDSIIVVTAFQSSAVLVTEDQQLRNIPALNAIGVS